MIEKLKEFFNSMEIKTENSKESHRIKDNFVVHTDQPFEDFTKVIVDPGINPKYPNGACGIYVDENFWCVAVLPYEFKNIFIGDMVYVFWPDIFSNGPHFYPDYYETKEDVEFAATYKRLKEND